MLDAQVLRALNAAEGAGKPMKETSMARDLARLLIPHLEAAARMRLVGGEITESHRIAEAVAVLIAPAVVAEGWAMQPPTAEAFWKAYFDVQRAVQRAVRDAQVEMMPAVFAEALRCGLFQKKGRGRPRRFRMDLDALSRAIEDRKRALAVVGVALLRAALKGMDWPAWERETDAAARKRPAPEAALRSLCRMMPKKLWQAFDETPDAELARTLNVSVRTLQTWRGRKRVHKADPGRAKGGDMLRQGEAEPDEE